MPGYGPSHREAGPREGPDGIGGEWGKPGHASEIRSRLPGPASNPTAGELASSLRTGVDGARAVQLIAPDICFRWEFAGEERAAMKQVEEFLVGERRP